MAHIRLFRSSVVDRKTGNKREIEKEAVMQFPGKKKFPFSSIVLVRTYDNETLMTGFITDEYPDGRCSVFVPTGPDPTT